MGKTDATKNNKSPTPLDKKGAKTLSNPYQCPTLSRGAGVGVSIDKCFTSSCIPGLVKRHFPSAFSRSFKSNTIMNIQNLTGKFYTITCARRSSHETTSKIWHGVKMADYAPGSCRFCQITPPLGTCIMPNL